MASLLGLGVGAMALWVIPRHPRLSMLFGTLACVMSAACMAAGALGNVTIVWQTRTAIQFAGLNNTQDELASQMLRRGESLAAYPLAFGIGFGSLPLFAGIVILVLGWRNKHVNKNASESEPPGFVNRKA